MDEVLVGVVILIFIGCVFWLVFPRFLDRFQRDDRNRIEGDQDNEPR